jgi:hypothetical protein
MSGRSRRAKPVSRFRHESVVVEEPASEAEPGNSSDEVSGAEKIEVHVHLHRDGQKAGARPKRRPRRSVLTGALFDWQGHYDRICKRPSDVPLKGLARLTKCGSCDADTGLLARNCPRCGAPRSRRALSKWLAVIGLGAVGLVFALCMHMLGGPVAAEQRSLAPVGKWSDEDDYYIIQVPTEPSPFTYTEKDHARQGGQGKAE